MAITKTAHHDRITEDRFLGEASRTPMTRPVLPVECEERPTYYTTIDTGGVRLTVPTHDIDIVARGLSDSMGTCGHDGTPLLPLDKAREIVKEAAALSINNDAGGILWKAVDKLYTEAARNVEKGRTTYTERRAA